MLKDVLCDLEMEEAIDCQSSLQQLNCGEVNLTTQ